MSSITKVTFSDDSAGTTNVYVVPLNPRMFDRLKDFNSNVVEILDGSPLVFFSNNDARVRTMKWNLYPVSNRNFSTSVNTMASTLRGYKGKEKYINLGTINDAFSDSTRRKIRVVDFIETLDEGGDLKKIYELKFVYID